MKNEAKEAGISSAKQYQKQIIAVSKAFYQEVAQKWAHGHFSTSKAQAHFVEGWMSAPSPLFVEGKRIALLVRIMNIQPKPLEEELYHLFSPYGQSKIEFVSETKICLTYRLEVDMEVLNWNAQSAFLKQKLVSYKLAPEETA